MKCSSLTRPVQNTHHQIATQIRVLSFNLISEHFEEHSMNVMHLIQFDGWSFDMFQVATYAFQLQQ